MFTRKQINITMQDGKMIYSYIFSDDTVKKTKSIVLCHGMAEHIERYTYFIEKLTQNGFIVLGYNQRGHKYTDTYDNYGYMGDTDNFNILVSDLNEMVEYMKNNYNLPVYLFGHSMGSFVSTRFIELYPKKLKGVILSGTGKNPKIALNIASLFCDIISIFKSWHYRSNFITSLSFGSFNSKFKPNRTDYDWLNTINSEVDKYIEDDWCGGVFTIKYYHDFFKGCNQITKNIKKIRYDLPILLISGENDPVGNMGKSVKEVYDKLIKTNHTRVHLTLLKGNRHEILLEKDKDSTISKIITFLGEIR